jgi:hypothetical protein
MTIREHVRKCLLWGIIAAFSSALAVILETALNGNPGSPLFIVGFIPFIGAILFMNFGIRCPKCRGNLGITIVHYFPLFGWSKHQIGFCPFCGTSIDQEIERDANNT